MRRSTDRSALPVGVRLLGVSGASVDDRMNSFALRGGASLDAARPQDLMRQVMRDDDRNRCATMASSDWLAWSIGTVARVCKR